MDILSVCSSLQGMVLQGPVVISRDHHDVSGTDSPFRETSNVYDGSAFTAGMHINPQPLHYHVTEFS